MEVPKSIEIRCSMPGNAGDEHVYYPFRFTNVGYGNILAWYHPLLLPACCTLILALPSLYPSIF